MRRFIFKTPKCLTWGFRAQLMAFIEVTRHLMDLIQLPNFTLNWTTYLVPTFKRGDLFKIQNYTGYFQHGRAAWKLLWNYQHLSTPRWRGSTNLCICLLKHMSYIYQNHKKMHGFIGVYFSMHVFHTHLATAPSADPCRTLAAFPLQCFRSTVTCKCKKKCFHDTFTKYI